MDTTRFKALQAAIEPARKVLEPFRRELADALRSYAGPHYGQSTSAERPLNMLALAAESLLQQLSSRAPQVLCQTHKPELKAAAIEMELAMNHAIKKMGFEKEHREFTLSAIFSVGIMLVGLDVVDSPEIDGEPLPITDVFVECINFEDFVFDTTATKWDNKRLGFYGHKYRVSLEEAKANKSFNAEARKRLQPIDKETNEAAKVSNPDGKQPSDPFQQMCELWQIFVPSTNEVVTFSVNGGDIPLKTIKWQGPKRGPYHFFGFNPVLNNIMPLPPVANWLDMDDLENKLVSKLGRQAGRQKTIGVVDQAGVKDGQTIMKTADGDVIAVGNPNAFKEVNMGGVNQQTLGFAINVRQMADFVMGNLSGQMGLGASADTLGQEKMIRAAANVRIASMQGVLLSATQEILRDVAFYLHHHPTIEYAMTMEIPGTEMKLPVEWPYRQNEFGEEVDVRKGEMDEYEISIQPYSMTEVSPGERAQLLRSIWAQDIMPMVQLGVQPDVFAYINQLAKYLDLPELRDIVKQAQESMDPQERIPGAGPTPGKPNGNYTRNNVSRGMTPQAELQQQAMMAMSAAGG